MSKAVWRGSFAIPMTPYDQQDRIDEGALRAEIQFCIAAGVGGICLPLLVSEFRSLSEDERRQMIRIGVEECRGSDVPVVANVAAVNTPLAVRFAEYAVTMGADAVMAMPPYIERPDWPTIRAYYAEIAHAAQIPVWIQNAGLAALSANEIATLCHDIEHVNWVKQEVAPSTHTITALIEQHSPDIHGVMGGAGGKYLIAEWARGAAGCIHACEFCDILQRIWDLLDAGKLPEAEGLFELLLPALVAEELMGMAYAKAVMVRRGVLTNNRVRGQTKPLDAADLREIDRIMTRLQPLLTQ
ncbi:MAG: dihydrodipicolinate synthase family protein [Anaerolineae bacterium]